MKDHEERLQDEYFKLQDFIEKNDDRALQIKGWSVTVSLAGVVAALVTDKLQAEQRGLALIAAATGATAFWLIEAVWKTFQHAFFKRINAIEDSFREGTTATLPAFQISHDWRLSYNAHPIRSFVLIARQPFVFLPHLGIAAIAVVAAAHYL